VDWTEVSGELRFLSYWLTDLLIWLSPFFNRIYDNINGPVFWLILFGALISGGVCLLLWESRNKK
jgi:hypothetical protein